MDNKAVLDLIESETICGAGAYMKTYAGLATFFRAKYNPGLTDTDIALLGVPVDAGLTQRTGARHAPREVRAQSANVLYYHPFMKFSPFGLCRVRDIGDAAIPGAFSLDEIIGDIHAFFVKLHAAGIVPMTVGGDHSITYPIMRALGASQPLGVIHFDAHLDAAETIAGSTLHHGSPFFNGVKDGVLDPKRTVHIGIRDPYEELEQFAYDSGMTVIDINQIHDLGVPKVIEVTRQVVGDGPVYITFDIDGLDPAFAPGTGTPVVGGLSSYEARRILLGFLGLNVVGGDVVEVSPPFDAAGMTSLAAAQILFDMTCLAADTVARKRGTR